MGFYSALGMGDLSDYWNFVRIHWLVSLKDALMVVAVYLIIGFLLRNCLPTGDVSQGQQWILRWNYGWLMLWLALPFWQAVIEYYSVYSTHRWAYMETMPLFFGIGLLPILQMLILPSVAIFLIREPFSNSRSSR